MKEFWEYFKENIKQVLSDLFGKDKEKRKKQIPNMLTLIRGILAPITIIPAVICQKLYLAFALIALCALTDSFDGWYARRYNAQSEFGALLDAICDKLFVLTLAFPLVFYYTKWIIGILVLEIIISFVFFLCVNLLLLLFYTIYDFYILFYFLHQCYILLYNC